MSRSTDRPDEGRWVRWWRFVVIATATLILCSCRAPSAPAPQQAGPHAGQPGAGDTLPPEAWTGAAQQYVPGMPTAARPDVPRPWMPMSPWRPPGIDLPWPEDEYVHDGGDGAIETRVNDDWQIRGLELGDTVAHFENVEGERFVQPSNRVDLYAPRFGAVRSVRTPLLHETVAEAVAVDQPEVPTPYEDIQEPIGRAQFVQPVRQVSIHPPQNVESRTGDGAISQPLPPLNLREGMGSAWIPQVIRGGTLEHAEKAYLARIADNAIVWTHDAGVQVVVEGEQATALDNTDTAQITYTVDSREGVELRLIKTASKQVVQPGDVVDFTIRYDNVGAEVLGNVVIVDNLVTRLEYVPESAQSSREAAFSTEVNENESLVLRWLIDEPLEPGDGGVVSFKCRVR